jgi:hypothetical protein
MMKKPIACVRVPCVNHGEFSLEIDPSHPPPAWLYRRKPHQVYLSPERHP